MQPVIYSFLILIFGVLNALGQSSGDYRSNVTTGNWNTTASWQTFNGTSWVAAGSTPTSASGVITIRTGHTITMNITSLSVDQVVIQSGGILNIASSRTLTVVNGSGDDLTVDGTLRMSGGTLVINSPSVVINNGFLGDDIVAAVGTFTNNGTYNGTTSTSIFNSIVVGGSGQTNFNSINVLDGGDASINGTNVNLYGTLTLEGLGSLFDADGTGAGVFRIISNSIDGTQGRIATLEEPGNFSGNVTVQRFINGVTNGDYRYISVPITDANASMLKSVIGVTGNFSDRSTHADYANIVDAGNLNASVYSFNPGSQTYTAVTGGGGTTASTTLSNLLGYAAYNFSNADVTINYSGAIGAGDRVIQISAVNGGFTLVPNPYPSPLNWDAVYQANPDALAGGMWWRTAAFTYLPYAGQLSGPPPDAGTGQIAIGQAVFAESAGNGSTITISETHKSGGDNYGIFRREETPVNYFRIMLASATQKDYAVIRFHDNTTDEKDKYYDAVKRRNGNYISATGQYTYINLSTYTTLPAKDFSINTVDELNECSKLISLKVVDVKPGDHSFQFTSLEKLELGYKVTLVDHFLNKEEVITNNAEYPFSVTADIKSFGDERFKLRIEKKASRQVSVQGQTLTSNITTNNQWYKDGVLIPGATQQTYDVAESGSYSVKSVVDGCEGTSESITMAITALPEAVNDGYIVVYPNPTAGVIKIKLPASVESSLTAIQVFDLKGSTIVSSDKDLSLLKAGEKTLDISNSKNGVYILNLVSGKEIRSVRLIKK